MSKRATHHTAADGASAKTKVLIADGHPLFLIGVSRALELDDEIEVIGQATTDSDLWGAVLRKGPDLVLMDPDTLGIHGADYAARLKERWPELEVVFISAGDERTAVDAALAAGASAYVLKTATAVDVAAAVRQAVRGVVYHAPGYARSATTAPEAEHPVDDGEPALTKRERTILTAVAHGETTPKISQQLWISEQTVKFHLTNIYRKFGVENRAAAIHYALTHGLVI